MNDHDDWKIARSKKSMSKKNTPYFYTPPMSMQQSKQSQRVIKKYPPPNQITGVISSLNVHVYASNLWKSKDYDKLKDLLITIKAIKHSIMHFGFDEPTPLNEKLVREIELTDVSTVTLQQFPEYLRSSQVLPTQSKLFDSTIWYLIYRAMIPTFDIEHNKNTFDILSEIYKNCLESEISRLYDVYTKESNVLFSKDLKRNNLKMNKRSAQTQSLRIKAYRNAYRKYSEFKQSKIKHMYEDVLAIATIDTPNVWKLFTLNLQESIVDGIDPMKCSEKILDLRRKYFDEHQNSEENDEKIFSVSNTTEKDYNDWILLYPTLSTIYQNSIIKLIPITSSSKSSLMEIIDRDSHVANSIVNTIINGKYIPFDKNPRLYRILELFTQTDDKNIRSWINKITTKTYKDCLLKLREYDTNTILNYIITNPNDNITYTSLYVKALRDLGIPNEEIEQRIEQINQKTSMEYSIGNDFNALVAALYIYDYIPGLNFVLNEMNNIDIVKMVLYAYEHVAEAQHPKEKIKELYDMAMYIRNSKTIKISSRERMLLLDIIDEYENPKTQPPKASSKEISKTSSHSKPALIFDPNDFPDDED